ncbi:zinc transporter ZupT [Acetivibrio cellulolyticus]|uniref:zinc transporter ZupT n=1 Tax=Acetivibrio cellulolyticus TaxID=35830 RepID=UPI00047461C4
MENVLLAFGLTLFAGLSTGIGGLVAFIYRRTNTKLLSVVLGFSAGVMIYVSFVEILDQAKHYLTSTMGDRLGIWITVAGFFGGMFLIAIIDKLIPSYENPHESHKLEEMDVCSVDNKSVKLLRTGLLTALAITIHNFPEGLATFTSAVTEPKLGIAIAIAVAIHNVPEGIAVSIPIYCATGSRKRAFGLSLLSGFSEPLGALIGFLILMPILNDLVFGILFAAIAGIMVFISLDELLPTAREYGEHHLSMYGVIGGMIVMALSLILFV